ncbi:MAG: tRNA1(Val) (adenine(37)-N6)-methyltransferase [Sodaliphilus sp.]
MGREKVFRFKQFSLLNDKTAMKVGTDGVLLGCWCDVCGAERVLDVGTGCGLIAIMVAQRNPHALIKGIDIDEGAVEEARYNAEQSPWANRISIQLTDFNEFHSDEKFDLVVSNPPYFKNALHAPEPARNQARHMTGLSIEQLIMKSAELLSEYGRLCLVTPTELESEIMALCGERRLFITKKTKVFTKINSCAKRVLWQICRQQEAPESADLYVYQADGKFTEEYIALCKEFYLHM